MKQFKNLSMFIFCVGLFVLGACNEDRDDGVIDWVRNGVDDLALRHTQGFALEFESKDLTKQTYFVDGASDEGRESLLVSEIDSEIKVGADLSWTGVSEEDLPLIALQLEGDKREFHFEVESKGSLHSLSELDRLLEDRHSEVDPLVLSSGAVVYLNDQNDLFYIYDLEKILIDTDVVDVRLSGATLFSVSYRTKLSAFFVYWSEESQNLDSDKEVGAQIAAQVDSGFVSTASVPVYQEVPSVCDRGFLEPSALQKSENKLRVSAVCDENNQPVEAWICPQRSSSVESATQGTCSKFVAPEGFEFLNIIEDREKSFVYVLGNWTNRQSAEPKNIAENKAVDSVIESSKKEETEEVLLSSLFVFELSQSEELPFGLITQKEFSYPEKISSTVFLQFKLQGGEETQVEEASTGDEESDLSQKSKTGTPLQMTLQEG